MVVEAVNTEADQLNGNHYPGTHFQDQPHKEVTVAQTAMEKLGSLLKGKIHGLLDKQIDANAPDVLKTYIREIEEQLEEIDNSAATRAGNARTIQRELDQVEARRQELDKNIELLISDDDPTNDEHALKFQVELQGLEGEVDDLQEQLASAQSDAADLDKSVSLLKAKHAEMLRSLRRLESMHKAAKAKETVAETVRKVAETAGGLDNVSVDDAAARLQSRIDVADEKFQRAMGTFTDSAENSVALAEAKARLAERIANKKMGAVPNPAPAS